MAEAGDYMEERLRLNPAFEAYMDRVEQRSGESMWYNSGRFRRDTVSAASAVVSSSDSSEDDDETASSSGVAAAEPAGVNVQDVALFLPSTLNISRRKKDFGDIAEPPAQPLPQQQESRGMRNFVPVRF